MTVNISELTDKLTTDPDAIGFSSFIVDGNNNGIVDAINGASPHDISFSIPTSDVVEFLVGANIIDELLKSQANINVQVVLFVLNNPHISEINLATPVATVYYDNMVTDGIITSIQRDAIVSLSTRKATWAEYYWGLNESVSVGDVRKALNI